MYNGCSGESGTVSRRSRVVYQTTPARNVGLSFNLTYSLGNKIRLMKICSGYASNIIYPQQNLRKEFTKRWRKPGDEAYTDIPGLSASNTVNSPWWNVYPATQYSFGGTVYDMYDNSNLRVVSGDYLNCNPVIPLQ